MIKILLKNTLFQQIYECSLTPGSSRFPQECQDPDRGVVRGRNYEQDPYVLYTVNAVYAGKFVFIEVVFTLLKVKKQKKNSLWQLTFSCLH